jgi:hypothetical protein
VEVLGALLVSAGLAHLAAEAILATAADAEVTAPPKAETLSVMSTTEWIRTPLGKFSKEFLEGHPEPQRPVPLLRLLGAILRSSMAAFGSILLFTIAAVVSGLAWPITEFSGRVGLLIFLLGPATLLLVVPAVELRRNFRALRYGWLARASVQSWTRRTRQKRGDPDADGPDVRFSVQSSDGSTFEASVPMHAYMYEFLRPDAEFDALADPGRGVLLTILSPVD